MPINPAHIQRFSKLELIAKQIVEGFLTGLHKSPNHGFSVEFAEHRIYNQGESTKNIDWKLYARSNKLYTKKYDEETNLRCHLIVDCSSSMRFPSSNNNELEQLNKLGFSMYAAAALLSLIRKQRDAVGLSFFDDKTTFHSPLKNTENHSKWLIQKIEEELFNPSKKGKTTDIITALKNTAERAKSRSLIIVFSDFIQTTGNDFLKQIVTVLKRLSHQQHEVLVFNVFDQSREVELNFDNRPYKFVDSETGESIKLNPDQHKAAYRQQKEEEFNQFKNTLLKHKIEYIESDINKGFDHILLSYLLKRKRLK